MSIIIKGMDMPTSYLRNVIIAPDGKILYEDEEGITYVLRKGTAMQLPPHGDLIDRDELKGIIGKFSLSWEYGNGVSDCWDALIEAPTIIEAEVEE